MLSPGKHHKKVPKEYEANFAFRKEMIRECKHSLERQAEEIAKCAEDALYYINAYVWQYNPNNAIGKEVGPFITYPFQDEAIFALHAAIEDKHDLVIEKSREVGVSWICDMVFEHLAHFKKNLKFLIISRNAEAVDSNDPDSLFWKLDHLHKWLPNWLKPRLKRRDMFFGFEETGSTITGQATTGKAGVGGRATAAFFDEFSQVREDYEVLNRTADTTKCRIFNGTHKGLDTAFHELTQRVDMKKLRIHWSQHPEKNRGLYQFNEETKRVDILDKKYEFPHTYDFIMDGKLRSPWYDAECVRRNNPRAVAEDLDIDPHSSMSQVFDGQLIRTLTRAYCIDPYWEGDVAFDPQTGKLIELVHRDGGPLRLWIHMSPDGKPARNNYASGADIAIGEGATPSVLTIFNADTGEQVAEYANAHIRNVEFGELSVALAWLFQNAHGDGMKMAWDKPGAGVKYGQRIIELGYRNVYFNTEETKMMPVESESPGWWPNEERKRVLIETYSHALKSRKCVMRSELSLKECLAFRWKSGNKIEHSGSVNKKDPTKAGDNHGDRVISAALGWKMVLSLGYSRLKHTPESAKEIKVGSYAWRNELHKKRQEESELF